MLVAVLSGFCLALGAPLFAWALKRAAGPILAIFPAFLFAFLLQFVPEAVQGRPWRFALPWDVASGLELSFRADGLSLLFGLVLALTATAALVATAAPELGEGARARLLVAITALFASALGLVLADQPILLVSFAGALSLAAFLAITAEGGSEARVPALGLLLAWLLSDLLLLVLLSRLFADVPGGLLGAGGVSGLVPNGRLEPAWLVPILALKAGTILFAMVARRPVLLSSALAAIAGLALPAMVCLLMRLSPILPEEGRIGLIVLALVGVLVGGVIGLGARRIHLVLAGLATVVVSAAVLEIALASDAASASALLIAATAALGLSAIYLLVPLAHDLNLKALRSEIAGTPLGASILIFALIIVAGLAPSTGLLALLSSASTAITSEPHLTVPATIAAFGVSIAIALRICAVLAFGEAGEARPARRAIPLASAAPLILVAIGAGCAPALLAKVLIGPAVRHAYDPVLASPSLEAWGLVAGCLALAALLFWQKLLFTRLLKALGKLVPGKPSALLVLAARVAARLGRVPATGAMLFILLAACASAFAVVGAAALAWPVDAVAFRPPELIVLVLVVAALIASAVAVLQRRFAPAVPIVAIAGALTISAVLALGAAELGFVMLLVLVIQTIVLLVMSGREAGPASTDEPRLAPALRLAVALIAGGGAALVAFGAGLPQAQAIAEPSGITGLVGASGLALREAGLTAIQRWSGVVLVLLILGVAVADLTGRARGET